MCPANRRRTVFGGRRENLTNSRAPAGPPGDGAGALARPAVAHRSSPTSRRAEPLSQVRHPRDVPDIPRSRYLDFRTLYRESQIRRSIRGRPISKRGRSETSLLGRPAVTPGFRPAFDRNPTQSCRQQLRRTRLRTVIPTPTTKNFEERGSEQLCRCPEILTPGFPEDYRETPQVCRRRPEIGRRSGRPLANPGRRPVRLERRVPDPYFHRTLPPGQPMAA